MLGTDTGKLQKRLSLTAGEPVTVAPDASLMDGLVVESASKIGYPVLHEAVGAPPSCALAVDESNICFNPEAQTLKQRRVCCACC
jgi:threonine dehydratase